MNTFDLLREPSWRWMWRHPARVLALGLGSGLSPVAPGTVGTLWGWLSFVWLAPYMTDGRWAALLCISAWVGWWACTVTARHLNRVDPGCVVWDEIWAFWCVLWLITPAGFWAQCSAFVLFRFFDAAKPGPVGWADRLFKGVAGVRVSWAQGLGIMWDDAVAALCTLMVLALWRVLML